MHSRRLRVSYRHPFSRSRVRLCGPAPMPFLRLQGRWLEKCGFAIGSEVRVQVTQGRLVLEVVAPERVREPAAKCSCASTAGVRG